MEHVHVHAAWQHNMGLVEVNVAFHVALETTHSLLGGTQQFPNASDHDTYWLGKHPVRWDTKHLDYMLQKTQTTAIDKLNEQP